MEPGQPGYTHERHLASFDKLLREVEEYSYTQGVYDTALRLRVAFGSTPACVKDVVVPALTEFLAGVLEHHPAIAQRLVDGACDPAADWGAKGRSRIVG